VFTFFLVCAAVGGTVLACQFIMTVTGLGGEHHDGGGHIDMGGDGHFDAGHAGHGDHHSGDSATHDHDHAHDHHSAGKLTWLFSFISFRSIVAGVTFFGLGGLAGVQSGLTREWSMAIALLAGAAAMYAVTMIMKGFGKLAHDGTVRIENALGKRGTVYIPIPAEKKGAGKIQLKVQNRVVEYSAVTSEPEKLPTGAQVEVVEIANSGVVEVKLVREAVKL
jgi:hypothetical protein